ncbi:MAG: hypothetical protein HY320_10500 [Armatimonadetes bacterium]|nr:hypothetical protein [Armatimonadota bacterium]
MKPFAVAIAVLGVMAMAAPLRAYPPAVGILGNSKTCLSCHVNNGPWTDGAKTLIDILDKESGQSLRQADGSFLIEAKRGQTRTVLTVIGRAKGDTATPPYRNAWLYIDPMQIETSSLAKFAPGWAVNLPMSCRIVGDTVKGYEGATITALPMTIRPLDDARDATIVLQVMLTRGESVKGKPKEGMLGNYFERSVRLKVLN